MIQLLPDIICYNVPIDFDEGEIFEIDGKKYINGITSEGKMYAGTVPLPPGSYVYICCSLTASEEDAAKVVETDGYNFKDYTGDPLWDTLFYYTASESLASLLKSHNLDPSKNWAIIKKK